VKEGLDLKSGLNGRKITARGRAGLAVTAQNRYISRNLWFSYDRVLRVGPPGPALFYYLNEPDADSGAQVPFGRSTAGTRLNPANPLQVRPI
jgi:hypothetical protein